MREIIFQGRKTAEARTDKAERFRINEAFHAYLETLLLKVTVLAGVEI